MKGFLILYEDPPDIRTVDVSISPAVDFWLSRHRRRKAISILTPPLPLYLAFLIKSRLEKHLYLLHLHQAENKTVDKAEIMELFRDAPSEWQNRIATAWSTTPRLEDFLFLDPRLERWIPEDAGRIIPFIEGRNGFIDQFERRLQIAAVGLRGVTEEGLGIGSYLPLLIQYLYLQREVEVVPGISVNLSERSIEIRCERCGSDYSHIHTYWCSLCETKDLICDLCYPMGASKGCSCLVRRAKIASGGEDTGSVSEEKASYLVWSGQL